MSSIKDQTDFSFVRYAQCWEDADILLQALQVKPGKQYVSIASGGENSFSILSEGGRVMAVDLNLSQLAVTDLKRVAYMRLSYENFLAFLGVLPSDDRISQYESLKEYMNPLYQNHLSQQLDMIQEGMIHGGKFEKYFALFRNRVLPLAHNRKTISQLMVGFENREDRIRFYEEKWDRARYRLLFQIFFSRKVMGKRGRDEAFFQHVEGSVASRIKERVKMGLIENNPGENPYLHYILKGNYQEVLPHALRRKNFDKIKDNISNLTLIHASLEEGVNQLEDECVDGYNLSDIFEYMSLEQMKTLYEKLLSKMKRGGRLVYWNMLAPRSGELAKVENQIVALQNLSQELLKQDKAFFYSKFVVEEKL